MQQPVHLVLNAGSSSLKFQVFEAAGAGGPKRLYRGLFEGLGGAPHFLVRDQAGLVIAEQTWRDVDHFGHEEALDHLAEWLRSERRRYRLEAVGHRVAHGGATYTGPVRIDLQVLHELERLVPLAPLHQPHNLKPIRIV